MTGRPIASDQTATKLNVSRAGQGGAFIVASVRSPIDAGQAAFTSYSRIADVLKEQGMEVVHERVFGSLGVESAVRIERRRALLSRGIQADGLVTYVEGRPPWGKGLAGVIIRAVSADKVWLVRDGNNPCGHGWLHNGFNYLILQNVNGRCDQVGENESKTVQAGRMIDRAERILRANGAAYADVARTWFYISDILGWYAAFNKVRNEKYGGFGIMPKPCDGNILLPASTGISGETPSGAAVTMDLLAIIGEPGSRPPVEQLTNTTQLDAFRYGSAFSRGALIREPGVSLMEISGTASIDEKGKSQFVDDICGQISFTLEKIRALMNIRKVGLRDIAAATVFVKSPEYDAIFWKMAKDCGLEEFPAVCVLADVCREELLFEIDAEALIMERSEDSVVSDYSS